MKFTFGIDSNLKSVFYLKCDFKINIIKFDVF